MIRINGKVTQFPFLTAQAEDVAIRVPIEGYRDLEAALALEAGAPSDNHTVYEVATVGRPSVYIQFSDNMVSIGTSVGPKTWR
jgi:hypothetical protein